MDSAYFYYKKCLELDLLIGNKKQIADSYSNLGYFFMAKRNFPEAEKHLEKSIELLQSIDSKPNLQKSYSILAELYANQNQFDKAFDVRGKQMDNNRLMIEEKEAAALAEYKVVYDTQKKEAKIHLLELENTVRDLTIHEQEQKIERRNYLVLAFALAMTLFLGFAYLLWKQQKLRNAVEREKAIKETEEAERIRMAKDIHDDLGSSLSKINFLSEIISQKANELPEIKSSTNSIQETAKGMIDNMRDLIWAMNPENATLANLVARMREHTTDFIEDYNIEIEYSFPQNIPRKAIKNEIHRALFLVVKEAVHNISKHAKATKIYFEIVISEKDLYIIIRGNGVGFELDDPSGNGLRNMKSRMQEIGGELSVSTKLGVGTEIKIAINLETVFKK